MIYNIGEQVALTLKLYNNLTNKFVRASVYTDTFSLLNTFSLTHVSNGLYKDLQNFPIGVYHIVYEVFKDSLFTIKDLDYSDSDETFRVQSVQDVNAVVNAVKDKSTPDIEMSFDTLQEIEIEVIESQEITIEVI